MPTQRSPYAFEIWRPLPYDPSNPGQAERIADISHLCTKRSFTLRRNRAEELNLSLNLRAAEEFAVDKFGPNGFAQLFDTGRNEIRVRRDDRYLFGVQLTHLFQSISAGTETLDLIGTGWLDLLARRYLTAADTSLTFTNVDIATIVQGLLTEAQDGEQGNILITLNPLPTTRLATAEYKPFGSSIKDMVQEISEWSDSIDLAISHDRKLSLFYPGQGVDKTDLHFWLGPNGNITDVRMSEDATQIVNESINRGTGNGLDVQPIRTVADAASRAYYGQHTRIDDYPATGDNDEARLMANGEETVRVYSRPMVIPDVVLDGSKPPFLGSYWVGDWLKFDFQTRPSLARASGRPWRTNEIAVNITENEHEEVRLAVGIS